MYKRPSKIFPFFLSLFIFLLVLNFFGCSKQKTSSKKKAIFDSFHREIFSPKSTDEMGFSDFSQILANAGYVSEVNNQPLTSDVLSDAGLLVLAGPMTDFNSEEIVSIEEFVKNGGNLLVLIHISQPVLPLTEKFDIQPTDAVICDPANPVEDSAQDFYITNFTDHALGTNMEKLAVFGTWGLRVRKDGAAAFVAKTSEEAWADPNQDRVYNNGELKRSYGIVATAIQGEGKVVVCADDAILINKYLKVGNNKQFGENIVSWFENKTT